MAKPKNDDFKVEDHPMLAKKKTSFSIAEVSQELMSLFSDKMGLKQSQIVELAPFLLLPLIRKSMERRRRSLPTIKTLQEQISRSLKAMAEIAPHFARGLNLLDEYVTSFVDAERGAIKENIWNGLDNEITHQYEIFFSICDDPGDGKCEIPPYQKELEEFVSDYEDLRPILPVLKITKNPAELPKSPEELDEFFYGKDAQYKSLEELENTIKERTDLTDEVKLLCYARLMNVHSERWLSFEGKSNRKE
jgi:hypothetical protein